MQCNKLTHIKLLTYHPDTAHICFDTEITSRLLVKTTNACGKPSIPENIIVIVAMTTFEELAGNCDSIGKFPLVWRIFF